MNNKVIVDGKLNTIKRNTHSSIETLLDIVEEFWGDKDLPEEYKKIMRDTLNGLSEAKVSLDKLGI